MKRALLCLVISVFLSGCAQADVIPWVWDGPALKDFLENPKNERDAKRMLDRIKRDNQKIKEKEQRRIKCFQDLKTYLEKTPFSVKQETLKSIKYPLFLAIAAGNWEIYKQILIEKNKNVAYIRPPVPFNEMIAFVKTQLDQGNIDLVSRRIAEFVVFQDAYRDSYWDYQGAIDYLVENPDHRRLIKMANNFSCD